MSVNCRYVCLIYAKIYEKMSSGGSEVSLSIDLLHIVIVQLILAENANHVNSEQSVHLFEYRDLHVHNTFTLF